MTFYACWTNTLNLWFKPEESKGSIKDKKLLELLIKLELIKSIFHIKDYGPI